MEEAQVLAIAFGLGAFCMLTGNVLPVGVPNRVPELLTVLFESLHTDYARLSRHAKASHIQPFPHLQNLFP